MEEKKKDYKIYVTYHRDELVSQYNLHEDEHHVLFASHKNIKGLNINQMNPVYSEMVTMWYIWKNNIESDYVGFEHYRRHLTIHSLPKKGECQIFRARDFCTLTIYEQYARCHNIKDMDMMLKVLENRYGKNNPYSMHLTEGHVMIANCCFLMQWDDFQELCEYLFPLLDDFATNYSISNTNVEEWHKKAEKDFGENHTDYQTRIVSFLAERLISAWISTHLKWWNGIDVAIVHYNTPELTTSAIKSLNKGTPGCRVTVFDNSDEKPFNNSFSNVSVINNTKGQIIDFDGIINSEKHCKSVDVLMDILPNGFILMGSDVLVIRDIRTIICNVAVCGTIYKKDDVTLFQPVLCWLNVPMLKQNDVRYFNGDKMRALGNGIPNNRYGSGALLFYKVKEKNLPYKETDIWQYIIHLGNGSWRKRVYAQWIINNKSFSECFKLLIIKGRLLICNYMKKGVLFKNT